MTNEISPANDDENQEIFRGHLEECMKHLSDSIAKKYPKGTKGAAQAKQPIADFCGVACHAVTRWFYDCTLPIGEILIRLMCYLDTIGYRVIELENIPKGRRGFAELIGYSIISGKQAAELAGYNSASTLYRVLQGDYGASEERNQSMWDAWKERKEVLSQSKETARVRYGRNPLPQQPAKETNEAIIRGTLMIPSTTSTRDATTSIMNGLLSLLEGGAFKDLTDQELTALQQSNGNTILRLTAQLNDLNLKLLMSTQKGGGVGAG